MRTAVYETERDICNANQWLLIGSDLIGSGLGLGLVIFVSYTAVTSQPFSRDLRVGK